MGEEGSRALEAGNQSSHRGSAAPAFPRGGRFGLWAMDVLSRSPLKSKKDALAMPIRRLAATATGTQWRLVRGAGSARRDGTLAAGRPSAATLAMTRAWRSAGG